MKRLYYRGNVFLAKDKNYTVLRIDKKVFKIPKDKFFANCNNKLNTFS